MKEEDNILKKVGKENVFRVPDGYFENLTSEVMSRLPEKETPAIIKREPTKWERIKPWVYMTAMFAGAALMIIRCMSISQMLVQSDVSNNLTV